MTDAAAPGTGANTRRVIDLSHPIHDGMVTYPGIPAPVIGVHLTFDESAPHYAAGTEFSIGTIAMAANTGTYLDTPAHRYRGGEDLSDMSLDRMVDLDGVVVRARMRPRTGGRAIDPAGGRAIDPAGGRAIDPVGGRAIDSVGGRAIDSAGGRAIDPLGGRAVDPAGGRAINESDLLRALDGVDVAGRAILIETGHSDQWGTPAYFADHPYLTDDAVELLVSVKPSLVGIDSLNIDSTHTGRRPAHTWLLAARIPIVEHLTRLDQLPDVGFRFSAAPPAVRGMGTFPVRAFAVVG